MKKKDFVNEILWLQLLACVLVVFGHSFPFVAEVPEWVLSLKYFKFVFNMPVFVMISGYLMVYTSRAVTPPIRKTLIASRMG